MATYNSVFTLAFSVDHDHHEGDDITQEQMMERLNARVREVVEMGENWREAFGGPEDTVAGS